MLDDFVYLLIHYFDCIKQVLVDLVGFSEWGLFGRRALLFRRNVHPNDKWLIGL